MTLLGYEGSQEVPWEYTDKSKLLAKSIRTIRLNVEGCVTSDGKEAISKGYQVVESILIKVISINNYLVLILCQHKTPQVRNFPLMNKLANISYVFAVGTGTKVMNHQRTWTRRLQHMVSPEIVGKSTIKTLAREE